MNPFTKETLPGKPGSQWRRGLRLFYRGLLSLLVAYFVFALFESVMRPRDLNEAVIPAVVGGGDLAFVKKTPFEETLALGPPESFLTPSAISLLSVFIDAESTYAYEAVQLTPEDLGLVNPAVDHRKNTARGLEVSQNASDRQRGGLDQVLDAVKPQRPNNSPKGLPGVLVTGLQKGSCLERAGVLVGDTIVEIGLLGTTSLGRLRSIVKSFGVTSPGTSTVISFCRGGLCRTTSLDLSATIEARQFSSDLSEPKSK